MLMKIPSLMTLKQLYQLGLTNVIAYYYLPIFLLLCYCNFQMCSRVNVSFCFWSGPIVLTQYYSIIFLHKIKIKYIFNDWTKSYYEHANLIHPNFTYLYPSADSQIKKSVNSPLVGIRVGHSTHIFLNKLYA